MRIGRLSSRVVIEQKRLDMDSPGGFDESWETRLEVWAEVVAQRPSPNSEAMYSGALRTSVVYQVTMRPLDWLTTGDYRLRRDEEILNIVAIDDTIAGKLVLLCESGVNRG